MTKTLELSAAARDVARQLAVCYQAFAEYRKIQDDSSVILWGSMLQQVQNEIGIHLHSEEVLRDVIHNARQREASAKRDADAAAALAA